MEDVFPLPSQLQNKTRIVPVNSIPTLERIMAWPACQAPLSSGPYSITETGSAHLSVVHAKAKTLSCSGLKA